jgi:phosphoglycolate phosphatase
VKATASVIIWDWNGTIVEDVAHAVSVLNCMLAKRDLRPVDIDEHRKAFGEPFIDYYRSLGFDFGVDSFESLCEEFAACYHERFSCCELRQGVRRALARFDELRMVQYLITSSEEQKIKGYASHHGLSHFFAAIRGAVDRLAGGKLEMAQELLKNAAGGEAVFIGDLVQDYDIATSLGARCILVAGGHQSRERLASCKGALIVSSLEEVADIIEGDSMGDLFKQTNP